MQINNSCNVWGIEHKRFAAKNAAKERSIEKIGYEPVGWRYDSTDTFIID